LRSKKEILKSRIKDGGKQYCRRTDDETVSKIICKSLLYQKQKAGERYCPPETPLCLCHCFRVINALETPMELKYLKRLLLKWGKCSILCARVCLQGDICHGGTSSQKHLI